jgi:hypothetical protein
VWEANHVWLIFVLVLMWTAGVASLALLLVPSLAWLFLLFQRGKPVSPPSSSWTAGR